MGVRLSAQRIGAIGENELSNLFLFGAKEFFAFAEDAVNGLSRAGIQAQPTGF